MGEARRRKLSRDDDTIGTLRPVRSLSGSITKLVVSAGSAGLSREAAQHLLSCAEPVRVRVRAGLIAASASADPAFRRKAISDLAAESAASYEAEMSGLLHEHADLRAELAAMDCRRGCAFCCHLEVSVTALEAFRLADLRAAAGHVAPDALGVSPRIVADPIAPRPCPVLADGACSVYEARPLTCRTLYSEDVGCCASGYAASAAGRGGVGIPSPSWPGMVASAYVSGQVAALDDLGLPSHLVALRPALAALSIGADDLLRRWFKLEDVLPGLVP